MSHGSSLLSTQIFKVIPWRLTVVVSDAVVWYKANAVWIILHCFVQETQQEVCTCSIYSYSNTLDLFFGWIWGCGSCGYRNPTVLLCNLLRVLAPNVNLDLRQKLILCLLFFISFSIVLLTGPKRMPSWAENVLRIFNSHPQTPLYSVHLTDRHPTDTHDEYESGSSIKLATSQSLYFALYGCCLSTIIPVLTAVRGPARYGSWSQGLGLFSNTFQWHLVPIDASLALSWNHQPGSALWVPRPLQNSASEVVTLLLPWITRSAFQALRFSSGQRLTLALPALEEATLIHCHFTLWVSLIFLFR